MHHERENKEIGKETPRQTSLPLIALEGVGGSGKSHIGELVTQELENQGWQVLNAKISGLGDSKRVQRLRQINDHREQLLKRGEATQKIVEDKKRDRIFRLATRHQIKLLLQELEETDSDIGILDRTPIMPWVYSSASDPNNPYLDEILHDGLEQTSKLDISTIFFLDVSPQTAYSRIIARAIKGSENSVEKVEELCKQINADKKSSEKIVRQTMKLISNSKIKPKEYRRWDFIPYKVMEKECQKYREVFTILQEEYSVSTIFIDAEKPIKKVKTDLLSEIKRTQKL